MRRGYRGVVALVGALLLGVGPVPASFGAGGVAAQEVSGVRAWAEIGSVRPGPGCWVETTVEVRDSSSTVPGVEVGLALVLDGEVLSLESGVTGDDGVAWLGFDTSAASAGAGAWLDVLLAGTYAGGTPIAVVEDGACAGDGTLLEVAAEIPLSASTAPLTEAVATDGFGWAAEAEVPTGASLWVPTYVQQRNLSCEYAALSIATGAWGSWVSEYAFDELVGWSPNPHWGYRGDINGWWGNTTDYGVYPEALVGPLAEFGFRGDVIYGQGNASALTDYLDAGVPVAVWIGLWGDLGFYEYTEDGTPFYLTPGYHVVVAYGYDDAGVYVSDPAIGDYRFFDWDTFMATWNVLDGMALAVTPY
jgi:uncharacterized protein YvpB